MKNNILKDPVSKCILKMAFPMLFGLLSVIMYNVGNTFFLGRAGKDALAAISFTFPVVTILNSIAFGLGIGVASLLSISIGAGDKNKVRRYTTDVLILGVILAVIFSILGFVSMHKVFQSMGANGKILELIMDYMRIWFLGTVFVIVPMVGNNAIRAMGDTKTPAIVMSVSGCVNLILDPLLIFGIGPFPEMGIKGAALATVISRSITVIVAFYILAFREKMIDFKRPKLSQMLNSWKDILHIGLPEAFTRIVLPLSNGVVTWMIAKYGVEQVAGFGVATKVEFMGLLPLFAVGSVIAPFIGQNLGAKQYNRVKEALFFTIKYSLLTGLLIFAFFIFFSEEVSAIFNKDVLVIKTSSDYLKIVSSGYGLYAVVMIFAGVLNVFRKPLLASVINLMQMAIVYLPLAFLISYIIGVNGIFYARTISFFIAVITGALFVTKEYRKMINQ